MLQVLIMRHKNSCHFMLDAEVPSLINIRFSTVFGRTFRVILQARIELLSHVVAGLGFEITFHSGTCLQFMSSVRGSAFGCQS
jgi:hypothetical protein